MAAMSVVSIITICDVVSEFRPLVLSDAVWSVVMPTSWAGGQVAQLRGAQRVDLCGAEGGHLRRAKGHPVGGLDGGDVSRFHGPQLRRGERRELRGGHCGGFCRGPDCLVLPAWNRLWFLPLSVVLYGAAGAAGAAALGAASRSARGPGPATASVPALSGHALPVAVEAQLMLVLAFAGSAVL
jgi:hypothetical protein